MKYILLIITAIRAADLEGKIHGTHSFRYDSEDDLDWSVAGARPFKFRLKTLLPLMKDTEPEQVQHRDICWKKIWSNTTRYNECDIQYPGIVVKTTENPCGLTYRMIDGAHRMLKRKMEHPEITTSLFYVIQETDFFGLLNELLERNELYDI